MRRRKYENLIQLPNPVDRFGCVDEGVGMVDRFGRVDERFEADEDEGVAGETGEECGFDKFRTNRKSEVETFLP